jgi:V/A-type H+-transporting ATPase subunit I
MSFLRPVRLRRMRVWLKDRGDFEALIRGLEGFGKFHPSIISQLPSSPYGESFYMAGWVPTSDAEEASRIAMEVTNQHCRIKFEEPSKEDSPPTFQTHKEFLKPFERLVNSFGIPSYWEMDPTPMVALSFALIFGFMFADIGHGLILAIVGLLVLYLRNKLGLRMGGLLSYVLDNGSLLFVCGISGILGGILFSDFFGYHVHLPIPEIEIPNPVGIRFPFRPLEEPTKMFKLSLFIGALHISIGLILNLLNKLLRREFREAFFEPVCWLWFYGGLMYSVFSFKLDLGAWTRSPSFLWCLILPSALMLIGKLSKEGLDGLIFFIEALISTVSNTISYLRIMALSLVHAVMGQMIINTTGGNPIAIFLGSLAVIALEGLVIFIHTTRLVWVEWFSKFYKGEGRAFKPLRLEEVGSIKPGQAYRDIDEKPRV